MIAIVRGLREYRAFPTHPTEGLRESEIATDREITEMISSIEPEEHALQASWAFTYFKKNQNKSYEDNTTTLGTVRSAEDFWRLYVHLRRPATGTGSDERTVVCDYHVFREGIKPMWEDDANRDGGKWIVRVKKGVAARYWEDVILAIVGGQFNVGDEICGAVLSVRYNEDIISLWNKSAESRKLCMQIRETLRTVMGLPADAVMEYKKHVESMRDNSSYRNTNAFDEKEGGGGGGGGGAARAAASGARAAAATTARAGASAARAAASAASGATARRATAPSAATQPPAAAAAMPRTSGGDAAATDAPPPRPAAAAMPTAASELAADGGAPSSRPVPGGVLRRIANKRM